MRKVAGRAHPPYPAEAHVPRGEGSHAAACPNESYKDLGPLFEIIKKFTEKDEDTQAVYVDKCCGPGSFGAAIEQAVPGAKICLDLAHFLRRMPKTKGAFFDALRSLIREMLWETNPAWKGEGKPPKHMRNLRQRSGSPQRRTAGSFPRSGATGGRTRGRTS